MVQEGHFQIKSITCNVYDKMYTERDLIFKIHDCNDEEIILYVVEFHFAIMN